MIKIGDLVKMDTQRAAGTGLIGVVVDRHPKNVSVTRPQIGIMWIGGSGKVDWEPEPWLEVVSESR
tara:strand:+ start:764 stop:961 length:198 start_codon:yes stop_codon:yes gene_type:complete